MDDELKRAVSELKDELTALRRDGLIPEARTLAALVLVLILAWERYGPLAVQALRLLRAGVEQGMGAALEQSKTGG